MESPELARPFAPHRLWAYVGLLSVVGLVFVFMTIAEATGLLPPTLTVDVAAVHLTLPATCSPRQLTLRHKRRAG